MEPLNATVLYTADRCDVWTGTQDGERAFTAVVQASGLPPAEQILGDFDQLERSFTSDVFRGCPFVNAVAELKEPKHAANKIAIAFKEQRRMWFRGLLEQLAAADCDALATQLLLLVDGAIAAALVRGDPKVARAAREAARATGTSCVDKACNGDCAAVERFTTQESNGDLHESDLPIRNTATERLHLGCRRLSVSPQRY